jgi:hypothetical protein
LWEHDLHITFLLTPPGKICAKILAFAGKKRESNMKKSCKKCGCESLKHTNIIMKKQSQNISASKDYVGACVGRKAGPPEVKK